MNAAMGNYDEQEFEYGADKGEKIQRRTRPDATRRSQDSGRSRSRGPVQFNGMHRRRRKRLSW